jgi:hypothetical protein
MKAFLIDRTGRSVEAVDLDDSLDSVRALIGQPSVDFDPIDHSGDRLCFDEACFIRAAPSAPRFRLDNLAPVAGRGVVIGSCAAGSRLADAVIGIDALRRRVTFT